MAKTAEKVFFESMGLASFGGMYEPKISDEAETLKNGRISGIEALYDKLIK